MPHPSRTQCAEAAGGTVVKVDTDNDDCDFEVAVRTAKGIVEVDITRDGTVTKLELDD